MNNQVTRVGFTVNAGVAVPRGEFKKTTGSNTQLVRIESVREIAGRKMFVVAVLYAVGHPARTAQLSEATFL